MGGFRGDRVLALAVLLMVAAPTGCASLGGPPAPPRRLDFRTKLQPFSTRNGIRLVLVEDHNSSLVDVLMRYDVGAIDDPPGKEGLAHLVEHLMFQQRPTGVTLARQLGQFAVYNNAFTTFDATEYVTEAPASHLKDVLMVEAMRLNLGCHTIPEEAFERERQVVINEVRERQNGGAGPVRQALTEAAYPEGHPYRRLVSGTEASVSALTLQDACNFVAAHYVPQRASLIVSGPVTAQELAQAVGAGLGNVPPRKAAPRVAVPPLPARHAVVRRALPVDRAAVYVMWPLPPRYTAQGEAGRMLLSMAEDRAAYFVFQYGGATHVDTFVVGGERAPMMVLELDLDSPADADKALDTAWKAAGRLSRYLEKDELVGLKQEAMFDLMAQYDSPDERVEDLADYVTLGGDRTRFFAGELQQINELSYDDVTGAAGRLFDKDNAVAVVVTPGGAGGAPAAAAASSFQGTDEARTFPVDPAAATKPMAVAVQPPANRAQHFVLENGMRVALFPSASAPVVNIRLVFDAGDAMVSPDHAGLATFAAKMLTPRFDQTASDDLRALQDFQRVGGRVYISVNDDQSTFSVHGLSMYVDILLHGLERVVRGGTYDQDEVEKEQHLKKQQLATASFREATASARALYGAVFGDQHPYATRGFWTRHSVETFGVDATNDFRSRYYVPRNATLVVSGRFDPDLVAKDIHYLFDDWSGGERAQPVTAPAAAGGGRAIAVPTTESGDLINLAIAYPTPVGVDSNYAARRVLAAMLDDAAASVRDELGASYGVSAHYLVKRGPGMFLVSGDVDAHRAGAALKLLRARIAGLAAGGDDVARSFVRARRQVVSQLLAEPTTASGEAFELAFEEAHPMDGAGYRGLAVRVAHLTLADLQPLLQGELAAARQRVILTGDRDLVSAAFAEAGLSPTVVAP